ncbi:MAG TPA: PD-(D/E)XK nuclease family protein [Gemmatimonadales bacterium]|nr:PD-(D/E)XK nuclease family protein [Gemmatimonadales bacterium]
MIVMPHWSASRFMLFDLCPASFKERYVDGVAGEPTEAMLFGSCVHRGLEAHYQGNDGERAFRAAWKVAAEVDLHGDVHRELTGMGIELVDKVVALGLKGVPERPFYLDSETELGAPIIGALDLWDAESNTVFDFKTTRGSWSQARAQREQWQPCLYTYAIWDETGEWPAFEYVVLNRATGVLSRFRREWTPDQWLDQMNALWARMCEVSVAVAKGQLDCHGGHGYCPECGERWTHEHNCDLVPHSRRVVLAKGGRHADSHRAAGR